MPRLHIFIADDQIPPEDMPEQEFRKRVLSRYGDNPKNRDFLNQCMFMREIVQGFRNCGYIVTAARTIADARKAISDGSYGLAIIDLGWYMDPSVPEKDRYAGAGWSLCALIDKKDQLEGKKTPQIVFSSHFPKDPQLSHEAAKGQKLPIFKEATATCRDSLMAAVSFVESSLAAQNQGGDFERELERVVLGLIREPLVEYRRWALLTLVCVAASFVLLLSGVILAHFKPANLSVLSSATSLVTGTVGALLYKRLGSAQNALTDLRKELFVQLSKRQAKVDGK